MGSRVGQEAIVTTPTEAARALQRLSVRSRWGKLTPAQRSEEMKRVRSGKSWGAVVAERNRAKANRLTDSERRRLGERAAVLTTLPAGTVPPPADASAAGSIRIRRAQANSGR